MKVLAADFVTSAADRTGIPHDGLPQIALVGRSNVGKSTLINALAGRRIAHTSAKPGKTRLANLYRVHVSGRLHAPRGPIAQRLPQPRPGEIALAEAGGRAESLGATETWKLYLVDLPGYGYTRGKNAREEFARITEEYFYRGRRSEIRGEGQITDPLVSVLMIVDARHPGLDPDLAARDWIESLDVPFVIAATKIDKLSRSERARTLREIERDMHGPVVAVSATSGEGLEELWTHLIRMASRP